MRLREELLFLQRSQRGDTSASHTSNNTRVAALEADLQNKMMDLKRYGPEG